METANTTLVAPSVDVARGLSERFKEPAWLAQRRLRALETYHESALPDPVTHLWRYTDPSQFLLEGEEGLLPDAEAGTESVPSLDRESLGATAVLDNGKLVEVERDEELRRRKVILMDLHKAAHEYPSLVEHHLGKIVPETHGKFEALNLALWQGGFFCTFRGMCESRSRSTWWCRGTARFRSWRPGFWWLPRRASR